MDGQQKLKRTIIEQCGNFISSLGDLSLSQLQDSVHLIESYRNPSEPIYDILKSMVVERMEVMQ